MARVLGIDYGSKRTGVALGETQSRLATPLKLLENLSDAALVVEIGRLAQAEGVELIVCGIPLNMDGSVGPQAEKVEEFIQQVAAVTGITIARVDE
ncbi:MAG: Holliday junction resolvase RuvX, partial [Phycisphaerae bacterium]|nr:Holliday junction resolvase RuvX [Phycisphaerae bacterium]